MAEKDKDKEKKCPDCDTELALFKGLFLRCPKCGKTIAA